MAVSTPASLKTWPEPVAASPGNPIRTLALVNIGAPFLIVAPHPDDESLGCGGLIALARRAGLAVHVVVMSDGCGSHPSSRSHPPERLAELRRDEVLAALAVLGVSGPAIACWGFPDRFVPGPGVFGHEDAVRRAEQMLAMLRPGTLVLPWRHDQHGDHRAAWSIWSVAAHRFGSAARILEYPIWIESGQLEVRPTGFEAWRLPIGDVLPQKRQAIASHRSQLGLVVTDDPAGFRLPSEMLLRFDLPLEIYLEELA